MGFYKVQQLTVTNMILLLSVILNISHALMNCSVIPVHIYFVFINIVFRVEQNKVCKCVVTHLWWEHEGVFPIRHVLLAAFSHTSCVYDQQEKWLVKGALASVLLVKSVLCSSVFLLSFFAIFWDAWGAQFQMHERQMNALLSCIV